MPSPAFAGDRVAGSPVRRRADHPRADRLRSPIYSAELHLSVLRLLVLPSIQNLVLETWRGDVANVTLAQTTIGERDVRARFGAEAGSNAAQRPHLQPLARSRPRLSA